jgi:hypothetical protein
MKGHYKYCVLFDKKEFHTNNKELAEKKAILKDGTMFFRPRYDAECRLIRKYKRLLDKGMNLDGEVMYDYLLDVAKKL